MDRLKINQKSVVLILATSAFRILISIYTITESKNGRVMVKYSNRLPVYRSNTFCLIQDDEYISKDAATLTRATQSVRLNHEMGEGILSHTLIAMYYISLSNTSMQLVFFFYKAFWV